VTARSARIQELIEEQINRGQKFTVEDMKRIQLDTVDIYARDNIDKILKIIEEYQEEVLGDNKSSIIEVTKILREWKGHSMEIALVLLFLLSGNIFSIGNYLPKVA